MVVADRIHDYVRRLPESLQAEVLHFAEYLLYKADRASWPDDGTDWSALSLGLAMRGMEDEETPAYIGKVGDQRLADWLVQP